MPPPVPLEQVQRIVTRLRGVWPEVKILLRADSGFARETLMAWCEENQVEDLFGLTRNSRLEVAIRPELAQAKTLADQLQQPVRIFTDFRYRTLKSWSRQRRVVAKAEVLDRGPNPGFVVTALSAHNHPAQPLYEQTYCARGEMENRIKEQQLDLFADRTSHPSSANPGEKCGVGKVSSKIRRTSLEFFSQFWHHSFESLLQPVVIIGIILATSPHFSVRHGKAPSSNGCKTRPTTVAPVGSSQGGSWRQRYGLKHPGVKGPHKAVQRTCGPERE